MVTQMTLIAPCPLTNPVPAIIASSPCSVIHIPCHLFRDVILFEWHLCCNIVMLCRIKFWSLALQCMDGVSRRMVCARMVESSGTFVGRKTQPRPVVWHGWNMGLCRSVSIGPDYGIQTNSWFHLSSHPLHTGCVCVCVCIYIYIHFFFCGAATQSGSRPPHSWGF